MLPQRYTITDSIRSYSPTCLYRAHTSLPSQCSGILFLSPPLLRIASSSRVMIATTEKRRISPSISSIVAEALRNRMSRTTFTGTTCSCERSFLMPRSVPPLFLRRASAVQDQCACPRNFPWPRNDTARSCNFRMPSPSIWRAIVRSRFDRSADATKREAKATVRNLAEFSSVSVMALAQRNN